MVERAPKSRIIFNGALYSPEKYVSSSAGIFVKSIFGLIIIISLEERLSHCFCRQIFKTLQGSSRKTIKQKLPMKSVAEQNKREIALRLLEPNSLSLMLHDFQLEKPCFFRHHWYSRKHFVVQFHLLSMQNDYRLSQEPPILFVKKVEYLLRNLAFRTKLHKITSQIRAENKHNIILSAKSQSPFSRAAHLNNNSISIN